MVHFRKSSLSAAALSATALLLMAACSTGQTAGSGAPASSAAAEPSASVSQSLGADQNGVPAAITAAGGTEKLTTAVPEGVAAEYGPICKGSDLGIGKIDFTTDTIGWAQSEKEANPFRIASTKSQVDAAK
ncbi:MAG: hypothetical protein EOO66_32810, partial [Methylobacterium sp.]